MAFGARARKLGNSLAPQGPLEVIANGSPLRAAARRGHHVGVSLVGAALGWSCSRRRPCPCTPPQRADIPGAAPLGALPLGCLGRRAGGVTRQPPLCAPSREPRRERCRFVSCPAWSLCLLPAGPHSCPTQHVGLCCHLHRRGHSAMLTVRSRPWVSFLQMQVRRAGCPASCTSHSRWPPGYKWLVCLPCPAAPLKQGFRGDEPRQWKKGARKKTKKWARSLPGLLWRQAVFFSQVWWSPAFCVLLRCPSLAASARGLRPRSLALADLRLFPAFLRLATEAAL